MKTVNKTATILVGGPDGRITKITGVVNGEDPRSVPRKQPQINGTESNLHNCCEQYEIYNKTTSYGIREAQNPGRE